MELQLLQCTTRVGEGGQAVFARAKHSNSPQIGILLGNQVESLVNPVGRQVIMMGTTSAAADRKREEGGGFKGQQDTRVWREPET